MFVPGMLRKLIAPRTPSETFEERLSHWSDLSSVPSRRMMPLRFYAAAVGVMIRDIEKGLYIP